MKKRTTRAFVVGCLLAGNLAIAQTANLVDTLRGAQQDGTDGGGPPGKGERDGQVVTLDGESFIAWDARKEQWLEPEAFWASFAERRRGKDWGSGSEFPPYAEVNEHDTFLLELDSGPCLMYFFHTRWRRANDVWRWGPEFNAYGGCPDVFKRR